MNLKDLRCVVTGGSTGIGLETARALAQAGARVAICARTQKTLDSAAESLAATGAEILPLQVDVTDESQVEALVASVAESWGGADVLVNNAGIGVFGSILDLEVADYDQVFAVNVRGLFLCTQAFAPLMVEQGDGVIVNVASLAGKNSFAGGSIYAASKHAVMGMSKSMMLDLRPRGVRVLTVCPGTVYTPFFDRVDQFNPDQDKSLRAEDVADMIVQTIRLSDRATISEFEIRPVNP